VDSKVYSASAEQTRPRRPAEPVKQPKKFKSSIKLQQAVITLMIHQLISPEEMEDQKRLFSRLDYN
jgi:hypothetical protein